MTSEEAEKLKDKIRQGFQVLLDHRREKRKPEVSEHALWQAYSRGFASGAGAEEVRAASGEELVEAILDLDLDRLDLGDGTVRCPCCVEAIEAEAAAAKKEGGA